MNDDVYLTMARNWKDQGDGIKPLLRLLEDPGALAAGKFGSDPAGALRQGITENLSDKDLSAAISLCKEAANTPAAGDYLLGLVSKYDKNFDTDTLFGLLQGVPDIPRQSLILRNSIRNEWLPECNECRSGMFDAVLLSLQTPMQRRL